MYIQYDTLLGGDRIMLREDEIGGTAPRGLWYYSCRIFTVIPRQAACIWIATSISIQIVNYINDANYSNDIDYVNWIISIDLEEW